MGQGFGGVVALQQETPEMDAQGGGIGESGDSAFQEWGGFRGAPLADEEEAEGGRDVGHTIAAGAECFAEFRFGLLGVAVAFVRLALR